MVVAAVSAGLQSIQERLDAAVKWAEEEREGEGTRAGGQC